MTKLANTDHPPLALFGSKWTLQVACILRGRIVRFGALQREHGVISQKVLSASLKLLEQRGLVERRHYPCIPPRVEYNLTEIGEDLVEAILPLGALIAKAQIRANATSARAAGEQGRSVPAAVVNPNYKLPE